MTCTSGFVLAAARSGSGKTVLCLGIMAALVKRGLKVQPFKIGPDFIDPTLHKRVTGRISYNLDLKMMGAACCQTTFDEKCFGADIAVAEGVMGLFDGGRASTAETAKAIGLSVILIVDVRSCAESSVAVLNGFAGYDPDLDIVGVIFNRIGSDRHRELITREAERKSRVPVLGYVYRDQSFTIPERHLGLVMGHEEERHRLDLKTLADKIEDSIDLDLLIVPSRTRALSIAGQRKRELPVRKNVIGVASDHAFCFYYEQNFELLERAGFDIVRFSPLYDQTVPEEAELLCFGGGYPELYGEQLSSNMSMIHSIRHAHQQKKAIYAECGGFMYLCRQLLDSNNQEHSLVGIFPFTAVMNKRMRTLGYRQASLIRDCLLGEKGDLLHGHEFHYSHIQPADDNHPEHLYLLDNGSYEGYVSGSAVGSYLHLHFGNTPRVIQAIKNRLSRRNRYEDDADKN